MNTPQVVEVDPFRIKFNSKNPRRHAGNELIRLRQSVKEVGIVQLPTVRDLPGGFYECIDGEGRILTAQETKRSVIWVVSFGILSDEEALVMLQAANSVRYFGFLAECIGMANLHRGGMNNATIMKKLGITEHDVTDYVSIGYIPSSILAKVQEDMLKGEEGTRNVSWSTILRLALPLRQVIPGKTAPGIGGASKRGWYEIEGIYDYTEVDKLIDEILHNEITSQEQLLAYKERRRREIFEQRFNVELRERLEAEIEQTRLALENQYQQQLAEEVKRVQTKEEHLQTQLKTIQETTARRYEAQVTLLQQQHENLTRDYEKLVRDIAKRPEIIEKRENELKTKLQDAETERQRFQTLQQQIQQDLQKSQADAQNAIQHQLNDALKKQREMMDQQLAQMKKDMEEYYSKIDQDRQLQTEATMKQTEQYYKQRDQERQLKAETSVRQVMAHTTELLSQTRQSFLNILQPGQVKGIAWLSQEERASSLAEIIALQKLLEQAREVIQHGGTVVEEGTMISGYQD